MVEQDKRSQSLKKHHIKVSAAGPPPRVPTTAGHDVTPFPLTCHVHVHDTALADPVLDAGLVALLLQTMKGRANDLQNLITMSVFRMTLLKIACFFATLGLILTAMIAEFCRPGYIPTETEELSGVWLLLQDVGCMNWVCAAA